MSKKTTDFLSICAGLDTACVTPGQRGASINQAISRFFNKAEIILAPAAARHTNP